MRRFYLQLLLLLPELLDINKKLRPAVLIKTILHGFKNSFTITDVKFKRNYVLNR